VARHQHRCVTNTFELLIGCIQVGCKARIRAAGSLVVADGGLGSHPPRMPQSVVGMQKQVERVFQVTVGHRYNGPICIAP